MYENRAITTLRFLPNLYSSENRRRKPSLMWMDLLLLKTHRQEKGNTNFRGGGAGKWRKRLEAKDLIEKNGCNNTNSSLSAYRADVFIKRILADVPACVTAIIYTNALTHQVI